MARGSDHPEADESERVVDVPLPPGLVTSGRTVPREVLAATPKRTAEDTLRLVPGLLIVQHGNQGKAFQLYLRGFDAVHGSDVAVDVDGVPINEPSNVHGHGYLDLAFLIPELIQRVDARKGAFEVGQGDLANAGSVSFRTGVPEDQRGTLVSYEFGSTLRHRAVVVAAPEGRADEEYAAVELTDDRGYGDNRDSRRVSAMGRWRAGRWGVGGDDEGHADLAFAGYHGRFGLPSVVRLQDVQRGTVARDGGYLADTGASSSRVVVSGQVHQRARSTGTEIELRPWLGWRDLALDESFTGWLVDEERGDRRLQTQTAWSGGATLTWRQRLAPALQLIVPLSWRTDAIAQAQRRLDQRVPVDPPIAANERDAEIRQTTVGAGAALRWAPRAWARLEAGGRVDAFEYRVVDRLTLQPSEGSLIHAAPRVALAFDPGVAWTISSAYGRGFRSPEARAVSNPSSTPADTTLDEFDGGRPEVATSDQVELGVRWSPLPRIELGVTGFGVWVERERLFDHVSGFNLDVDGTRRLGLEGYVQARPLAWLWLGGDVAWVDAAFRRTGNPVPGVPTLYGQLQATLAHPRGWRASARGIAIGPRPLAFGAQAAVTGVLDVSVGYERPRFGVNLTVDNVIGTDWREGEWNFASWWDRDVPRSALPAVHIAAGYPRMVRGSAHVRF